LEVGDTAGLETCATKAGGRCLEKSSRFVTILMDSSAESAKTFLTTACRGESRNAGEDWCMPVRAPSEPARDSSELDDFLRHYAPDRAQFTPQKLPFVPYF